MDPAKITEILDGLNLRLDEIADQRIAKAVTALFHLIEELNSQNAKQAIEIKYLRKENKRLGGDDGDTNKNDPDKKKPKKDHSSEGERNGRKSPKKRKSNARKHKISHNRIEICEIDKHNLPRDAEFKGYKEIIVQEIMVRMLIMNL